MINFICKMAMVVSFAVIAIVGTGMYSPAFATCPPKCPIDQPPVKSPTPTDKTVSP